MARSLKTEILVLRNQGLSYKEICNKINCSISTVSYYCRGDEFIPENKRKIPNEVQIEIEKFCKNHTNSEATKKFGFSLSTIKRYSNRDKKKKKTKNEIVISNRKNVQNRRKKLKLMSIEYLGGECKICKYNTCPGAMEFHHKNPLEKDFNICRGTIAWDKIKKELDKCVLLCCRCHREVHAGLLDI